MATSGHMSAQLPHPLHPCAGVESGDEVSLEIQLLGKADALLGTELDAEEAALAALSFDLDMALQQKYLRGERPSFKSSAI